MRILVVDSDRDLVEMLTSWLKTHGFEVCRAYSGERARVEWLSQQPDLVILDPTLKDVDGLAMCRELRSTHDALILVLTDAKDFQDEVHCLESAADDYLRKPFFPAQLLARIHAVSRRARATLEQRPPSVISVGPIVVDSLRNEVRIHGKIVHLTPTEGKLLHLLASNAHEVCTVNQIVTYVWGYNISGDAYLIRAHIHHLRQKIEPDPGKPRYILTLPGVGYTLVHPDAGVLTA